MGSWTTKRSSHDSKSRLATWQANGEWEKGSHDGGSVQEWVEVPPLLLSEMAAVPPAWLVGFPPSTIRPVSMALQCV